MVFLLFYNAFLFFLTDLSIIKFFKLFDDGISWIKISIHFLVIFEDLWLLVVGSL